MNPLVPGALDVVLASVLVAHVLLAIVALVLLARTPAASGRVGSILLIVLVPVAGPVLWLAVRRTEARATSR